ncbi:uncharacterized protein LOC114759507 [Neltuma alba]|uniref:uncharacterized protein LOC114759507 n=1 Tax=Neltuma alba TaxID=207710 RepID=UPI0010A35E02|nr:uncharacterized protein LOC114759507 [Prosopis alba]
MYLHKGWQMSGLPCPHACAAIKKVYGNAYMYVEDCFLLSAQKKIYGRLMIPVETHDIPRPDSLRYEDYSSTIFLQPPLTTRRAGRPRGRRIESQFQQKKAYHCSGCGEAGHTRKICTNPNPG